MTSPKDAANAKIHDVAQAAKAKTGQVIDRAVDVANSAVEKAGKHVHDAGKKVQAVGERIVKASE